MGTADESQNRTKRPVLSTFCEDSSTLDELLIIIIQIPLIISLTKIKLENENPRPNKNNPFKIWFRLKILMT